MQHLDRGPVARAACSVSVAQPSPSVATSVSGASAATASAAVDRRRSRRRPPAAAAPSSSSVDARQDPVDGAEEQRGVVLVDQHRQAAVGRAAGCAALHPQVGGVAVVAVGDQGRASRPAPRRAASSSLGVADRPDPVPLARRGRRTRRSGSVASTASTSSRTGPGPRCTSRIGAGLSCHLGHPVGQLVDLHGVDALVREDRPVGAAAWRGARCRGRRPGRAR